MVRSDVSHLVSFDKGIAAEVHAMSSRKGVHDAEDSNLLDFISISSKNQEIYAPVVIDSENEPFFPIADADTIPTTEISYQIRVMDEDAERMSKGVQYDKRTYPGTSIANDKRGGKAPIGRW